MKFAVCDDCPTALKTATEHINAWAVDRGIEVKVFTYDNGDELLKSAVQTRFDAVFLDIIMPLLNGLDTARELRRGDASVPIIFLTSSPEFALESYEVKAFNYLLKPIDKVRLTAVLDDCAQLVGSEPKTAVIKTVFGWQKLYLDNVECVEAQNKKTVFHLKDGVDVESTEPLHNLENRLPQEAGFFKCHRSYVVCLQNVDRFDSSELTTFSGRRVPIARGYNKAFKEAYFNRMFGE